MVGRSHLKRIQNRQWLRLGLINRGGKGKRGGFQCGGWNRRKIGNQMLKKNEQERMKKEKGKENKKKLLFQSTFLSTPLRQFSSSTFP